VFQIPPITADGKLPTGQPVVGLNQRMVAEAFALPAGGEGELVDLGKGEYYALRVDKVMPAAVPTLEEIRPQLTQFYMTQELRKRIQAKAEALAARVRKGESPQAVADSAHLKLERVDGITRAAAAQQQNLGRDFLTQLFAVKAGEVFITPLPGGVAVAKVTSIKSGDVTQVGRLAAQGRRQMTQQMVQGELSELVKAAARAQIKPKVDEKLARQAIGVAPEDAPAAGKAPPKAPPAKSGS
jgi:peptidyl-prolyl cis-trans isomerase D